MEKLNPHPIKNTVLVRQEQAKDRIGSGLLYAPQGLEEWPPIAIVLEIGPGCSPHREFKVGDRVLFKRQPDSSLVIDEREGDPHGWRDLLILDEDHVLGVVDPDEG